MLQEGLVLEVKDWIAKSDDLNIGDSPDFTVTTLRLLIRSSSQRPLFIRWLKGWTGSLVYN